MYRVFIRSKNVIVNFNSESEFKNYLNQIFNVGIVDTFKNVGGVWVKRASVLR